MNRTIPFHLILVISFLVCFPSLTLAKHKGDYRTFHVFFENDLFGDTDKYYTNAVQATWISKDLERYLDDKRLPEGLARWLRDTPLVNESDDTHNVGLILGQHIYTPENIRETDLIVYDRPYAGFLYAGLALHRKTQFQLDTVEAVFGIIGPSSLAEQAQNTVHRIRDIDEALGWDNQLGHEPGIRISWQRKWRFEPWHDPDTDLGADWITHAGVTLGNVRTSANAGFEVRFGIRIPQDFGSDVIRPGSGISAPLLANNGPDDARWGLHAFAGTQLEYVARDVFLDGNTWKDSHSVEKEPWIIDMSVGLAFNFDTIKLTYRHLFRTRQFENQSQGHTIGSLTLTWSF
ncbi:MAG: lipid A deacylase LpxR family protein [Desulfobacteraceae bacterium]|nr:MAG: lipid A deacylase LpxR family protein [Desulfobacteraceae bacterium]